MEEDPFTVCDLLKKGEVFGASPLTTTRSHLTYIHYLMYLYYVSLFLTYAREENVLFASLNHSPPSESTSISPLWIC